MPTDSAGLGLAIVPKILDLHGSQITVSSEIDAGTTFAFDLPAAQAA
ncbi:MAG: ATP-binding protein [Lysobacterales bacterium]